MDANEKKNFRTKKVWKDFRHKLMEERESSCELCGTTFRGKRKRGLQVHHLDPDDYTNLDPKKFILLCSSDHDLVERITRKILSKSTILKNKKLWYDLLKDVLPYKARERFKLYLEEDSNGQ